MFFLFVQTSTDSGIFSSSIAQSEALTPFVSAVQSSWGQQAALQRALHQDWKGKGKAEWQRFSQRFSYMCHCFSIVGHFGNARKAADFLPLSATSTSPHSSELCSAGRFCRMQPAAQPVAWYSSRIRQF
jgi:hypothetical protein